MNNHETIKIYNLLAGIKGPVLMKVMHRASYIIGAKSPICTRYSWGWLCLFSTVMEGSGIAVEDTSG